LSIGVIQIVNSANREKGGAENLVQNLHRQLEGRGLSSWLVSIEACGHPSGDNRIMSLGYTSPYDFRALFRLAITARRWIASADIVHAHLFPTSLYIAVLNSVGIVRAPCVFTEHSTSNRRRGVWWLRPVDRWIYSRFARVVAISDGVRDALVAEHPELESKVTVVKNGIELRPEIPERLAGKERVRLVSAGRLKDVKNYSKALKSVAILSSDNIGYSILGDGPMRASLEAFAVELGVEGYVEFAGHVGDVKTRLEAADIFLMPSKWEGFGLAAVEAMNAGLPLVVSDVPGLREVVGQDGDCAFLVDPEKPEEIAAALRRLIEDPDLRARMGRRAFERSLEFSEEAMVDAYVDVYRTVMGASNA